MGGSQKGVIEMNNSLAWFFVILFVGAAFIVQLTRIEERTKHITPMQTGMHGDMLVIDMGEVEGQKIMEVEANGFLYRITITAMDAQ
jgi:hypothetical protein